MMKFQFVSGISDLDIIMPISRVSFFFHYVRRVLFLTILTCFLLSGIIHAQYLYPDSTFKSSYPENKNLSFDDYGFTKLFDFYGPESGKWPEEIIISDNWLYGLNYSGGEYDYGLIFKIKTDGSGLMKFVFDGAKPNALVLSGSVLYGTTRSAGTYNGGVLYRINTDGSGLTILYNFQKEFTYPVYSIIISGSVIYGHVFESMEGSGFIFKINTDGSGFVKLSDISKFPYADLLLYDNYLYGITMGGSSVGEIFKLKNDGTGFLILHSFTNPEDGQKAYNPLTIVGTSLYGTTESGGINNKGTLFKIDTDGTNFEKLYDFSSTGGYYVRSQLVLSGSYLYGTAMVGGNSGLGTIFRFNKDGSGFEKLYDFQEEADGMRPEKFVISEDTIFGYTAEGGINNDGILYRFALKESTDTIAEHPKVIKLAIKKPEQVTLTTKENLVIENGEYINLDTTFSVTGNIQYTYSWKVKTDYGYEIINKTAEINSDSTFYIFLTTIQGCSYLDSVFVKVNNDTEINDIDINNQINIYPNPNTGECKIKLPGGFVDYSYDIFNIAGTKVTDGKINCTTEECIFDIKLTDAKPGVYTLVINKNGTLFAQKRFIVTR